MLDVNFWQNRYETANTPWDLGRVSPHFEALWQRHSGHFPPGRMAVPGAGRGHDAAYFADLGFDVVAFDYAPSAIVEGHARYGDCIRFEQADITDPVFAAPGSLWHETFDYLLEHTCFCAIHPKLRADYVRAAVRLLKPGGHILAVFWDAREPEGPPYNTTPDDITRFFGPAFEIRELMPQSPVADREGTEYVAVLTRKATPFF